MQAKQLQSIVLLAAAIVIVAAPYAAAQDYPHRPITLIVNFPPGGSTDAMARILREPLSQALGQSLVIDNRGGAGGTTGAAAVAAAKADGYTLLLTVNSALTTNKYLQKNFPLDPKTAFAPITLTSDVALVSRCILRCRCTMSRSSSNMPGATRASSPMAAPGSARATKFAAS